jgi:hypothetical protein
LTGIYGKFDWYLETPSGGTGTFVYYNYALSTEQSFVIDKASQEVWYQSLSVEEGGGGWTNASLKFYSDTATVALPPLYIANGLQTLPAGTYTGEIPEWHDGKRDLPVPFTFFAGESNGMRYSFNGTDYYTRSGTISVSVEGAVYTISVDLNVSSAPYEGNLGKITGTYTGYLTME